MSIEYVNPFGERAYQPEVDGMRRWYAPYTSMSNGGEYRWWAAPPEGLGVVPDLGSKRSAHRVEKRRRKDLERRKRNQWVEVQP